MTSTPEGLVERRLSTPRAAAVAGLLFTLLFGTAVVLVRTALPGSEFAGSASVAQATGRLRVAITLMPFAGIAFLWFLGVVRDRLGELEDRFFASVMLGSGLLFLAMVFVAMAIAGGILVFSQRTIDPVDEEIIRFAREIMLQISNVYALRMAAVFMISVATIWLRTSVMPRWIVISSYVLALALLVVTSLSLWVTLIFPVWVAIVSLFILVTTLRANPQSRSS
jgi:hypothetical protein